MKKPNRGFSFLAPLLLVGCSSGEATTSSGSAPGSSTIPRPSSAPSTTTSGSTAPSAAGSASASPSSSALTHAPAAFPPPALKPPVAEVAAAGDGEWTAMNVDGVSPALAFRTALHPRKDNKAATVHIVAFDFKRVELGLLPGTKEPINPSVPFADRPGKITEEQTKRLVAFTNGGWLSAHQGQSTPTALIS